MVTSLLLKKSSRFANRGKRAEDAATKALKVWEAERPGREFQRLVDTKAAGRTIKAAVADFEFYAWPDHAHPIFGLIEVKETEHNYRLARDKVPQLPRIRQRELCGGAGIVLVLHSTTGLWRAARVAILSTTGDKGSWNLSEEPTFASPRGALAYTLPEVFGA